MSFVCEICGKGPWVGKQVSHSHHRTSRRWLPNVQRIRILREGRFHMKPFFTKTIPLEQGVSAFCDLGLDLATLNHHPKKAMKIILKP